MKKTIVKIDPDIEELIPGFLQNRIEDITTLKKLLIDGDYDAIRILGHSMKGFGSGYGFDEISVIGANLEIAAKDQLIDEINKQIKLLEEYIAIVEIVYE